MQYLMNCISAILMLGIMFALYELNNLVELIQL